MEICGLGAPKLVQIIRNPLLLEKIAKHLPPETLVQLRVTCVDWNKTFLPQLKKKHKQARPPEEALNQFTETMLARADIPFCKYQINSQVEAGEERRVNFFVNCGRTITSLEIGTRSSDCDWWVGKILYNWCPELTDLTLRAYDHRDPPGLLHWERQTPKLIPKLRRLYFYGEMDDTNLLREILKQATELQRLEIRLDVETFLPSLHLLQELNCVHKLKSLTGIQLRWAMETMQSLVDLTNADPPNQLRLERFQTEVNFEQRECEEEKNSMLRFLHTFLTAQATCLRQLHLSLFQSGAGVQVPKMETLSTFSLFRHPCCGDRPLQLEGRTLAATFQALTRFEYTNPEIINMDELALLRHEGVTDLVWKSTFSLTALRIWFPAVTVTRAEFTVREGDQDELALLWNNWPALQSLHVKYDPREAGDRFDLDLLLSGVRISELEGLEREFAGMDANQITMEALSGLQRKYKTRFGIGDQKHLQKFSLEFQQRDSVLLSGIGGYLGLALAPQSLHFEIKLRMPSRPSQCPDPHYISAKCMSFIKVALGPFAVISL